MENIEFINPNCLLSRQIPREMSGSKIKRLQKNIRENGFNNQNPIDVAEVDGKLIILDGHHRVEAAKKLKLKKIPIIKQQVSFSQAEQLLIQVAEVNEYNRY